MVGPLLSPEIIKETIQSNVIHLKATQQSMLMVEHYTWIKVLEIKLKIMHSRITGQELVGQLPYMKAAISLLLTIYLQRIMQLPWEGL